MGKISGNKLPIHSIILFEEDLALNINTSQVGIWILIQHDVSKECCVLWS